VYASLADRGALCSPALNGQASLIGFSSTPVAPSQPLHDGNRHGSSISLRVNFGFSMTDQAGRRRSGSWDGSSSRPNSSSGQQQLHNQLQDQHYKAPGVYLRGIPKDTAAEVLEEMFADYGVSSVQVVPAPHYSTDIAFVNFDSERVVQQVRSCKACFVWCACLAWSECLGCIFGAPCRETMK
jgi:hypothetical protein